MQTQKHLNQWLWRWHIIAGLISLPFMLMLSITGILYLFKEQYNNALYNQYRFVDIPAQYSNGDNPDTASYSHQLRAAHGVTSKPIMQVILPTTANQATAFRVQGKQGEHTKHLIYVNPYTAEVTGQLNQRHTLMYKIRKLHGELLLSQPGTYLVELVASWFLVLIATGLYIWWPGKRFEKSRTAGFFTVRIRKGKRVFYRDLHAVGGFWLSIVMAVILAGGMPWTEFFGDQLKWVQKHTDTGYPKHWKRSNDLQSNVLAQPLSLEKMVSIAQTQKLKGAITINLPLDTTGVFSLTNRSLLLRDQQVIHFDQYSGAVLKQLNWSEVGILMELRQVAMRFHQGEYGLVNWLCILLIVITFSITTAAGMVSYLIRRPKGRWGLPKVPTQFKANYGLVAVIALSGLVFPLFGASVVLILSVHFILTRYRSIKAAGVSTTP